MRLPKLNASNWIGIALVMSLTGLYAVTGGAMFNPGTLSQRTAPGTPSNGSHATLQCSACHAPAWGGTTMTRRCADCHAGVQQQIATGGPLHGRMANAEQCLSCHTEHKGSMAPITSYHGFDHNQTAFPLTGKHMMATCVRCHGNTTGVYKLGTSDCSSCHREPKTHVGVFKSDCASCHNTSVWSGVQVANHKFPVNHHGSFKKGGCATCHNPETSYADYTCYNCHQHEKNREIRRHPRVALVKLDKCADCHAGGR